MVRLALAALPALAFALALAAWVPATQAGTADAPEVSDATDDHTIGGIIPLEGAGQFINADITAAWIEDSGSALTFTIQLQGTGAPTTTTNYDYAFNFEVAGTAGVASCALGAAAPVGSGVAEPGDAATACVMGGDSLVLMTVPKDAIGATAGATLTGLFVEAQGTPVTNPLTVIEDRAPDADFGADYVVGSGGGNGTPGDSDGDGLNDTWEIEQFGNVTAQNGTGDPDGDDLNNTEEFAIGTNATNPDTDGDGLDDKEDPFPLDPTKPGGTGNGTGNETEDLDGDGLPDAWEREHFNSTTAQDGDGDPDTDGLSNEEEFDLGTDPTLADTDGDGLNDSTDPDPLVAGSEGDADRLEMYAGAPMFAAIATLCLFALARK
jgi:hypothetical protein